LSPWQFLLIQLIHVVLVIALLNCCKLGWELICSSSCKQKISNEIILISYWSVRESESSCTNFTIIIKIYIWNELFSTDTILLTAFALYLNLDEEFNLIIKIKNLSFLGTTIIRPISSFDEWLEWSNPWVNWWNNWAI